MNDIAPQKTLGVLPLIFITAALFMTLRNMPIMAETGLHMVVFNIITVFAFLMPIALRYSRPEVRRAYRVPGGNIGMLAVCGVGFFTALACLFIGFIPPTPDPFDFWAFEALLIGVCLLTFVIGAMIPTKRFLSKQTEGL